MKDRNLRDRLITVLVGIPLVLASVFFVPMYNYILFSLLVVFMATLGSLEMSRLLFGRHVLAACLAPIVPMVQYLQGLFGFNQGITELAFVLILLFCFATEIKLGETDSFKGSLDRISRSCIIIVYPGFFLSFFLRMLAMEGMNSRIIMTYLILAFGNDVFAYVWGRLFGKNNKGILKASPNKSVAGFVGSLFTTIGLSFACFALFRDYMPQTNAVMKILLGVAVSISQNVGDLLESVLKRSAGVKDSGRVIPGRGGALDCLDSEIFSAPMFFIILNLIMEAA